MSSPAPRGNRSTYEGIKKHNELMISLLNNRSKKERPTNPDSRVSPLPRTDLDSPKRNKIPNMFSSSGAALSHPVSPGSPEQESFARRPSPRHPRLKGSAIDSSAPLLDQFQSLAFRKGLASKHRSHKPKNIVDDDSYTGDVRERLRFADALNDVGIPIDNATMQEWMNHKDFDGVSFNSLVILYQIKLKELHAHVARIIDGYPNKSKTSLVCGVFDALSEGDGRYSRMLKSLRTPLYDAIYVKGMYQDGTTGKQSLHLGTELTWYELAKELAKQVKEMKTQAAVAERGRKLVVVKKRMQKLFVERSLGRVQGTLLRLYFENWARRVALLRSQREKIITYVGKQFSRNDRMELKYRYELWRMMVKHAKEDREQHESYMDLTDELEAKERKIVHLNGIIMQLKDKLKQLFKLVRFNFEDFKMEVLDLMEIFVEAQNQQNALVSGPEHDATKPEMVDNWCQTNDQLEKIKLTKKEPAKKTEAVGAKKTEEQKPKKKKRRKKVYKSKVKLTLAKVLDYIACMYEKKVKADAVDDKSGKERDTLPEFCEDFFTQMFGIEALAGKKRYELEMGVKKHSTSETRVKWFGTMMGWKVAPHEGMEHVQYNKSAIDVFLYVLSKVFPPDAIEERMDDDPCLIKLDHCLKALNSVFRQHLSIPEVAAIFQTLRGNAKKPKKGSLVELDFDFAFDAIMRLWYSLEKRPEAPGMRRL